MTRNLTVLLVGLTAFLVGVQGQEPVPDRALPVKQLRRPVLQPNQAPNQFRVGPRFAPNVGRPGIHEPFTPPVTASKIRTAIDDAVFYLRSQIGPDGSIHGDEGSTSLARPDLAGRRCRPCRRR